MSFEYIIWSFPASTLVNIPLVVAVQCFFAHQIYHLCRPRVKLWVTAPIILSVVAEFGFTTETAVLELVNRQTSVATQMTFYGVTPAVTVGALAEIMITISLCILLYDRRSGSALSRTKRLLNTLIIYAVNRCLLILLIAITALVMTMEGQDTWFLGFSFVAGRLYANAFLASLNCRERLRSQGSGTPPIYSSVVSISPTRRSLRGTSKISRVEQGRGDVVDTTKYAASDRTAKLRSEGKV
ncbi:hypothetical protein EDD16DRAFT_1681520 [Pisolithus croceorrhizus]|nr:hypothetical protein EDD16DRAFT_1681520 [Pisolithus croceorrhizus]